MRKSGALCALAASALVGALAVPASAKPNPAASSTGTGKAKAAVGGKAVSACGIKFLPLLVGNSWTYKSVAAPIALPPVEEKQTPLAAKEIVVTVASIETKGNETIVTFDETVGTRKLKSTLTCGPGKVDLSPDAFWFGGEPGGFFSFEFPTFSRKGTTWVLTNGTIGDNPWREDIVATWKRTPTKDSGATPGSGKLEIERQFTPALPETINTPMGTMAAEKLAIQVTGRITLDGAAPGSKPYELKAGLINSLWAAEGVGIVQVLNSYAHMYVLTAVNLAGAAGATPPATATPPVEK